MQTATEYLILAERYAAFARQTKDHQQRHLLEGMAASYRVLAESTEVLKRSRKVHSSLETKGRLISGLTSVAPRA